MRQFSRLSRLVGALGALVLLGLLVPRAGQAQSTPGVLLLRPVASLDELPDGPPAQRLPAAPEDVEEPKAGEQEKAAEEEKDGEKEDGEDKDGKKKDADKKKEPKSPWAKVPPVRVFPRPGNFAILPTGPGYYSARDFCEDNFREKPPRYPYPPFALMSPSFFDADFRYLEDPKNEQHDFFDHLHRVHLGCDWLFSTGGQAWWRHMREVDSRFTPVTNEYDLYRTRVFGDLWYRDLFRFYVEFIDAASWNEDLPPLPIDEDRHDLQNIFVDLYLFDVADKPVYLRGGRQELLFGSQRLISPPDWANTRRTFQGLRAFRATEKFDVDLFWVQPVVPDPHNFNSVDNDQNFAGLWTQYRPEKGLFVDLYYLFLDDTSPAPFFGQRTPAYNVHTWGSRYAGDKNNFLWDVEGMFQYGERGRQDILAGAFTTGAGYHFKCRPMTPTVWIYYDYASGDRPGGHYTTFNQLFPFGHYYFGYLDLVGRQNIHDLNLHLYFFPSHWITCQVQFHDFHLDSARSPLFTAGGAAIRQDPTGRAGRDVGNEIDLAVNFHLSAHSDVLLGYSKLFSGDFLDATAGGRDPELFYAMYNYRW